MSSNKNNQLKTQLLNNGQKAVDQNDQLDNINRIGEEANQTGINTLAELKKQRGQLEKGVNLNKDISREVHNADRITTEMQQREFCIKIALWICVFLLFVADIAILIHSIGQIFTNKLENQNTQQLSDSSLYMIIDLHDAIEDEDDNLENIEYNPQNYMTVYMTKTHEQCNDWSSFILLLKGYFSIGILALPFIFHQAGYILASLTIIVVGCLTVYSVKLLLEIAKDINDKASLEEDDPPIMHYSDIAGAIYGSFGVFVIKIFTVSFQLGSCLSYLIFFNRFFEKVLKTEKLLPAINQNISGVFIHIMAFLLISLLSTINNIQKLTKFCFIGIMLSLFSCTLLITFDINLLTTNVAQELNVYDRFNFENFPSSLSITVFQFSIIGIVFNVKNNMQQQENFIKIFSYSTGLVTFLFILFGSINQLALGNSIQQIILFNYPENNNRNRIISILIKFSYAIAQLFTFPLKFLPAVLILENTQWFKRYFKREFGSQGLNIVGNITFVRRYFVRLFIIFALLLCSQIKGEFTGILSIVGSIGGIFNQFVFPAMMYDTYFSKKVSMARSVVNKAMHVLGILGGLLGIYQGFVSMKK